MTPVPSPKCVHIAILTIVAFVSCGAPAPERFRIHARLGVPASHVSVFEDSRPVLASQVRTELQVDAPAGCRLELAYAGLAPEEALRVSASIVAPDGRRLALLEDPSPSVGGWHDRRVPIAVSGKSTLELAIEGRADAVLWAQPLVACPVSASTARRPNVLMISLDTLRADRLASYGSRKAITPHLDRFARSGALFENAYSQYPNTIASHASLFTGLYPSQHGLISSNTGVIPPEQPTLAGLLAAAGYRTAAFTEDAYVGSTFGFNVGFDAYHDGEMASTLLNSFRGDVHRTVERSLAWLSAHADEEFFLFVHTYKVHAPRSPGETTLAALQKRLGFSYTGKVVRGYDPLYELAFNRGTHKWSAGDLAMIESLYDAETVELDKEVGRLLAHLEVSGVADSTLVVVLSDHGEEFGEHGAVAHGNTMYDQALRVPLVFRLPGRIPAGLRVPAAVGIIEVGPTVLELAGVDAALPAKSVRSLGRYLASGAPARGETVVSELHRSNQACDREETDVWKTCPYGGVAIRDDRYSFLSTASPAGRELYDRRLDPGEMVNIAAAHPELVAKYETALEDHRNALAGVRLGPAERTADPATRERLRGLGYLE